MSKPKNRKPKTRKREYDLDADGFVDKLHRAIKLDLDSLPHVYGGSTPGCLNAAARQVTEFKNKYIPALELNDKTLEKQAFQSFRKTNAYMRRIGEGGTFPDPSERIQRDTQFMTKVHLRARALMHFVCRSFSEDEFFRACKNSPGASVGVPFADTSLRRKFTYPISGTARAIRLFQRYLIFDPQLEEALTKANAGSNKPRYLVVDGSSATTVEKNVKKRRFIAKEPTLNMFFQQGLMVMLYRRMDHVGLSVERLPSQHVMRAYIASITGSDATIDWADASNCVGIKLLQWNLPRQWFAMLDYVRSPVVLIDGLAEELHMFSSMGNAGTFPLETLVFWTYAHAVRLSLDKHSNTLYPEWEELSACSVFGDDCIVPVDMATVYIQVMETLGFGVNEDKSFYGQERFRESCGGDFTAGYPERPWNIGSPHNGRRSSWEAWLYTMVNELTKKYIQYFGSLTYIYDKHAYRLVLGKLQELDFYVKVVPPEFPSDAGILGFDPDRLMLAYPGISWSRIEAGPQGSLKFQRLSFQYSKKLDKLPLLELWDWLRKQSPELVMDRMEPAYFVAHENGWRRILRDQELKFARKEAGGYVVASGSTVCWTGPIIGAEHAWIDAQRR